MRASTTGIICVAAVAALVTPTTARAQTPSVINACLNPGNGGIRVVGSSESCGSNEVLVQWNVAGPAGRDDPGPTGPPGSYPNANSWQHLFQALRPCSAPFNRISATTSMSFGGVFRINTICGTDFITRRNFQDAGEMCFALGGHIPTVTETYILGKKNGLSPNVMLNGDLLGNRAGDDQVLIVDNENDLNDFDGIGNKNDAHWFRCVQTSTIVQ